MSCREFQRWGGLGIGGIVVGSCLGGSTYPFVVHQQEQESLFIAFVFSIPVILVGGMALGVVVGSLAHRRLRPAVHRPAAIFMAELGVAICIAIITIVLGYAMVRIGIRLVLEDSVDNSQANAVSEPMGTAKVIQLPGADLEEHNFYESNLQEADLSEAILLRANVARANLGQADLSGANLTDAKLYGANLHKADLSGADCAEWNVSTILRQHALESMEQYACVL